MEKKFNINFIVIALIAVLMTTIGIIFACYRVFEREVQSDLRLNADILMQSGIFNDDHIENDSKLFSDFHSQSIRITWIDSDGTVLYDNDVSAKNLGNHLNRPEIKEALEKGYGESVRKSDTFKMNTFYYALMLEDGTILRVSKDAQTITSMFMSILPIVFLIMFLIVGACILISRLLTKQLIDPINKMAEQLDDAIVKPEYKELIPFANKIQAQHENILIAAKSRQDFTANVSHELKTPLTAISGYAELIENEMIDFNKVPYVSKQIRDNANRLLSLINDIIRLSELDHKEIERDFKEFDLYVMVKNICSELKVNANQKRISLNCKGYSAFINGDVELIRQLIVNLVQNAIQYTNENGQVDVVVQSDGQYTKLIVKDNGIGIPKEAQDRVFERFYRVDKSRSRQTGGTGLGLAIVKHIVEIHDAKIELKSDVNQGTEIMVIF